MRNEMLEYFLNVFGDIKDTSVFFAPGRVNLIGEHTDYNGGHVFPCALTIGTYAAVRKRNDQKLCFYSVNFKDFGTIESSLDQLVYDKQDNWANYPKGVFKVLIEAGYKIPFGLDIVYYGTIPNSSGLSSSASIEVLTAYIAKELFGLSLTMIEAAKLSQKAENQFIGVNCGIMDQFAIAMGKQSNAIFLDTADLSYEYAPIELEDAKIVIACSNKKRGLSDSKYNERRSECESALEKLKKTVSISALGELSEEEFEKYKGAIQNAIEEKRAKHAVYENQRTIKAVAALKANNLKYFGKLMNESHISLRDDYEVTGLELDTLVEEAWKQPGVIGSRMTGAGFGGCTVSIVKADQIDSFIETVGAVYLHKIGYSADFYVVEVGGGPCVL